MNIFFDVDETLVTWDFRLRPHVREVFKALRTDVVCGARSATRQGATLAGGAAACRSTPLDSARGAGSMHRR